MTISDLCGEIHRNTAYHHGKYPDRIFAPVWQLHLWSKEDPNYTYDPNKGFLTAERDAR